MNRHERHAQALMYLFLTVEERTGSARIFGTLYDIGQMLDPKVDYADVSAAMRLTRTPEFIETHGFSIPSLGNGRSGAKHGYTLEYARPEIEVVESQLHAHAKRLQGTLRSVAAQYELAQEIVDGRTATAKKIRMAVKAVDLAADALEVGVE